MNSSDSSTTRAPWSVRASLLAARAHSWCGIWGLGSFTLLHLWAGISLLFGREGFATAYHVHEVRPNWFRFVLFGWVFVPWLWHAAYGLWLGVGLLRDADALAASAVSAQGRRRRALQALSGSVLLMFMIWHLAQFSFPRGVLSGAATDSYDRLVLDLSTTHALGVPLAACLYTFGSVLALVHAGYGFWSSIPGSALRERFPRAAPRFILGLLGLTLLPVWIGVLHFATGWP